MYHVTLSVINHLARSLLREGVHQLIDAVACDNRGVEDELFIGQFISVDEEAVGHHGVPVVELAELQSDPVAVLEVGVEKQAGIELQLQPVAAEVLHVLLYHYLYCLP